MPIVFSDKDLGTKLFFDDDKPDDGYVIIRSVSVLEMKSINKRCDKKQPPEYRRGVRYEVPPKINEDLKSELIWDSIIVSWDGIVDDDGKPVPVITQNKIKFMSTWPFFMKLVTDGLEQLSGVVQQSKAKKVKNLSKSQSD